MKMLGESLGQRTLGVNVGTNIIGKFDLLLSAEFPAMHSPLEGKTLTESRLREKTGLTVVGLWEHGIFQMPLLKTESEISQDVA